MKKVLILFVPLAVCSLFALYLVVDQQQKKIPQTPITSTVIPQKPTNLPENKTIMDLTIVSPQDTSTGDSSILIKGKTTPLVSVMINEYELTADTEGFFSRSVDLEEGENYFNIIAYDKEGNTAEQELVITRDLTE